MIAAGITGVASLLGGKAQAKASTSAANISAQAARDAARLRAGSEAQQLKYLQDQSSLSRSDTEDTRRANFGQWNVGEQNVHNRLRDSLLNQAAANRARSLTDVDLANAAAGNTRAMFDVGRGDENMMLARQDQRMGRLGEMLGSRPRDPVQFDQIAALREATAFDPGAPIITDRETTDYVPLRIPTRRA
jgi:hypothetical protein